jgi:hypothetical protein
LLQIPLLAPCPPLHGGSSDSYVAPGSLANVTNSFSFSIAKDAGIKNGARDVFFASKGGMEEKKDLKAPPHFLFSGSPGAGMWA